MKLARLSGLVAGFTLLALLGGCAPTKSVDYSAFKQAKPRSILVLPPLNESPDVKATYSMLSQVTFRWPRPATTWCRWRWPTRPSARTA